MTNHWIDLKNAKVFLIQGSNAAENHPMAMKWVMRAKQTGAVVIVVDPRYTRTAAVADIFVRIRPGTDIAFLNAIINYILTNKLYDEDFVINQTNALYITDAGFAFEDGLFSGYDASKRSYVKRPWGYVLNEMEKPLKAESLDDPECVFSRIKEFFKRYQLPAIIRVTDWHRAVREFFTPIDREDSLTTDFVHADEAEASVSLLLFPEMLDMKYAVDAEGEPLLPGGHFDTSVDPYRRPQMWQQGEGHSAIERAATPEGVVGHPTRASAEKAKRPIAAILKYLTLVHDEILETYPAGKLPPVEKISLRDPKEMEPFLREPMSEGWKSVYELPYIGQINSL